MVDVIEAMLKGLAMGLLLVISVGPVIFTIIKQSINNGKEGGFSFVIGVWVSDFILIVLSNVFSELVTHLLDFEKPIGIAGSIFLLGMGVYYLFFKKVPLHPEDISAAPLKASDHAHIVLQGFLLNTLNPACYSYWFFKIKKMGYQFRKNITENYQYKITDPYTNYKAKASFLSIVDALFDYGKNYRSHRNYQ